MAIGFKRGFSILIIVFLFLAANFSWFLFSKFYKGPQQSNAKQEIKTKNKVLSEYTHPPIPFVKSSEISGMSAESFILIDDKTNQILISKNPNLKIFPASTTKLATALTALNIYPLDELVTVTQEYNQGKVMNLKVGEKITVKSLVSALLVYSANDSAFNLALHYQDGVDGFMKQMNSLVQKYGLKDTNFVNFDGIHNTNHFSTVYDLSQLGRISIKNPIIREVVKNKNLIVTDVDNKINHKLVSTNELLGVLPEIEGLKTGWTPEAGGCFVGLININGHELISVVAQSADRFTDTRHLVDWVKQNVEWKEYSIQ